MWTMAPPANFCGHPPVYLTHNHNTVSRGGSRASRVTVARAEEDKDGVAEAVQKPVSAGLKALWVVSEQLGKVVGGRDIDREDSHTHASTRLKLSREEVIAKIKDDYTRNYFIGGISDMTAYDDDCLFTDPFAGFRGTERFKQNLSNFGGVTEDVKLDWETVRETDVEVETKWRFSAILKLPWRPRLAAAGRTTHVLSPTGLVVEHNERWDADPGQVVKLLLRPASPNPQNRWEEAMLALSKGDAGNFWLVISPSMLKVAAPLSVLYALGLLQPGLRLQGFGLGVLENISVALLVAASLTEVYKLSKR